MANGTINASDYLLPSDSRLRGIGNRALVVGLAAAGLSVVGLLTNEQQFYRSYLVAFLFWMGPALGSMGILMLQHITGGRWGVSIRRILEAGVRTMPLMALLFLPIIPGMHDLYEWTHADVVAVDPVLQHKEPYLNTPFFLARAAFYFLSWLILAFFLCRWSIEQDSKPSDRIVTRLQFLARGGLCIYALTMTFGAFDWAMSITPHWYSHIYGVIVIGGQILTSMAFAITVLAMYAEREPFADFVTADRFHDLGKLLLAFIMLWAYFALSQYLIIWSANLPEETPWYLARLNGGWEYVGGALILFHFALPFVVLLSRSVKRKPAMLARVTAAFLVLRFVDLYWLVAPGFSPGHLAFHWLDVTTMAAIGGVWIGLFVRQLDGRPLLPVGDPAFLGEYAGGYED